MIEKKEYRTIKKAGIIAEIPKQMATITIPSYQNATSLLQEGNAYLQPLVNTDGLTYENNKLFFRGLEATVAELKDNYRKTVPADLDVPFIQLCFSIILANFNETIMEDNCVNQIVGIYYPKLAQTIGKTSHANRADVLAFINKIQSFQTIMGIIDGEVQPVLMYAGEDRSRNVIFMASPYLVKVVRTLFDVGIRQNKQNNPILKKDGTTQMIPTRSYLINSEINNEKNKRAIINVNIIVALIERAGNNIPHIKARTIIERNPQLYQSLEGKPLKQQNQTLKRTFKKTWELLRTRTRITEVYNQIQIPDPNDPKSIPTTTTLDMVFEFKHNGKKSITC